MEKQYVSLKAVWITRKQHREQKRFVLYSLIQDKYVVNLLYFISFLKFYKEFPLNHKSSIGKNISPICPQN